MSMMYYININFQTLMGFSLHLFYSSEKLTELLYFTIFFWVLFCFVLSSEVLYLSLQDPHCPGITTIHVFIRLTIHTTTFVVALSLPFNLFGGQRC